MEPNNPEKALICSNCLYFKREPAVSYGECVRYPQRVRRFSLDWCGEFHAPPALERILGRVVCMPPKPTDS